MLSEVTKSYQGFTKTITKNNQIVKETWHGFKNVISGFVEDNKVGSSGVYGELTNIQFTCKEGPIWKAELTWEKLNSSGDENWVNPEDNYGPERSSLTTRQNQMSIETHHNYKLNWNNFFIIRKEGTHDQADQGITYYWNVATIEDNIPEEYAEDFKWIKDRDDLPEGWEILYPPQMPGVEYYFIPYYELTQIGTHGKREQTAWAVSQIAGKIANPTNGDFGIVEQHGGNWLCQGATINYDGKYWVAQCSYTWSPDGWEPEIYEDTTQQEN